MSASKDTLRQTVIVALLVCLVCSIVVSSAAVMLKGRQDENKLFERNSNVLSAAGMYTPGEQDRDEVQEMFKRFEVRLVDVATGQYLTADQMAELGIDPDTYDQRRR